MQVKISLEGFKKLVEGTFKEYGYKPTIFESKQLVGCCYDGVDIYALKTEQKCLFPDDAIVVEGFFGEDVVSFFSSILETKPLKKA